MNTISNTISSEASEGGQGSIVPVNSPRTKLRRLTYSQFITYIGCLVDITSKKGKTIAKQSSLAYDMFHVLDKACKDSNGGLTSFHINQEKWETLILPDGTTISKKNMPRIIKNIIHHSIVHIISPDSVRLKTYQFGQLVLDVLDPVIRNTMKKNRCGPIKRSQYEALGYDVDTKKVCPTCHSDKFITNFGIHQDEELSIVLLKPVCDDCIFTKNTTKIIPDGWNGAWNEFFIIKNKIKSQINI
jgi:hypothetical protein